MFTSSLGSQDHNATFTSGQVLRIIGVVTTEEETSPTCSVLERVALRLIPGFFALAILGIALTLVFRREEINAKLLLIVFVGAILGIVFVQVIASNVIALCG